jgi:transcriptional regulator GlxA family with amidase domain
MSAEVIAVIAFDNISPFQLSVPCMVFGEDRRNRNAPTFTLLVCSAEEEALRSDSGFGIVVSHTLRDVERADIVIVPSWRDTNEAPPQRLLAALRAAHERGTCSYDTVVVEALTTRITMVEDQLYM